MPFVCSISAKADQPYCRCGWDDPDAPTLPDEGRWQRWRAHRDAVIATQCEDCRAVPGDPHKDYCRWTHVAKRCANTEQGVLL